MGTRSLTFVYEDGHPGESTPKLVCMYRQYDSYPTGHGAELAEFLLKGEHNGMGCLAASMIAHFKKSVCGFYIHPVDSENCSQEYEYHISENSVTIFEMGYTGENKKVIFDGTYKELKEYCSEERYEEEPVHAFDSNQGRDWLKSILNDGVATIHFLKSDGTVREMKCTLDRKIVPQVVKEETKKTKVASPDVLPVYDIEAQGWRSFRWDSIIKVDIKL